MLQSTLYHEVPWPRSDTLNFEFVWFRLKPGWPSGCFLKKLGSTVSLFPRVYFIHGEWEATILNRIEWKRNPPPQKKQRSNHAVFPLLILMGGRGELILSIFRGTCLLENNTYQNKTKQVPS